MSTIEIIELFLLMRMALESSILSQPTFCSSRSFSNPEVFKAFGLRKTGIFGSQARLGLLSEDNEDVGNNQNLILVKRGILVAMVCSVLVFGCKRVFAVEGVVNAGYGKLVSLDLSGNYYQPHDRHTVEGLVQNLTEYRYALMNLPSSLRTLNLKYCDLRGKFPKNIFHLPNLKSLYLGYNENLALYLDLSGMSFSTKSIDSTIGNLQSLKYLDLSWTSFLGGLPESITNLSSLEHLDASDSSFSGGLPNSIGNLVSLDLLIVFGWIGAFVMPNSSLFFSQFRVETIIELFLLMRMALESSILSQPTFCSSRSFSNPEVFKAFGLRKTGIFGSQARLGLLSEDNEDVGNNQNLILVKRGILVAMVCSVLVFGCKRVFAVEGVVNAGYGKLVSLDLSGNYYQPHDRHTVEGLVQNLTEYRYALMNLPSSLRTLNLKYCDLRGKFPKNIFHLPNLKSLYLGYNENLALYLDLSGMSFSTKSIDSTIGNLQSLKYLDLSWTSFPGGWPKTITNLSSLEHLDASDSSFSGGLPNSIGNLVSLEVETVTSKNFSLRREFSSAYCNYIDVAN
ncbi:Leucine-rich repeat - like 10 [Theobroma cacao]|nr:Leucine-rich repeat - like 10 [Theobroma cacao]